MIPNTVGAVGAHPGYEACQRSFPNFRPNPFVRGGSFVLGIGRGTFRYHRVGAMRGMRIRRKIWAALLGAVLVPQIGSAAELAFNKAPSQPAYDWTVVVGAEARV